MKLQLKTTDHNYYCQDSNYYVDGLENFGLAEYESWNDFQKSWFTTDLDYNHCFRFDIKNKYNSETDSKVLGEYSLHLYYILQRKGNFVPVYIKTITEDDMEEINSYLQDSWDYIKQQWEEFI